MSHYTDYGFCLHRPKGWLGEPSVTERDEKKSVVVDCYSLHVICLQLEEQIVSRKGPYKYRAPLAPGSMDVNRTC